jgi:hypothetical protein
MRPLARELRHSGYERTERESPFHDEGTLWTNSYELVCDKTAQVIRKDGGTESTDSDSSSSFERHEYYNSENPRMMGGYVSAYDWGHEENNFRY